MKPYEATRESCFACFVAGPVIQSVDSESGWLGGRPLPRLAVRPPPRSFRSAWPPGSSPSSPARRFARTPRRRRADSRSAGKQVLAEFAGAPGRQPAGEDSEGPRPCRPAFISSGGAGGEGCGGAGRIGPGRRVTMAFQLRPHTTPQGVPISSVIYNYVRSLQLEGSYPEDAGSWPITGFRVQKGWGWPLEAEFRYPKPGDPWPPAEPPGIDLLAKRNRVFCYHRVRTVGDCELEMATGSPVVASFEISDQWSVAPNGKVTMPKSDCPYGHCVVLDGYDRSLREILFRNSWGENWGDHGRGAMPYEYFDHHVTEAWVLDATESVVPFDPVDGIGEYRWGRQISDGILHGAEFYDSRADERMAWAFARPAGGLLDVEELYVRPAFRGRGYGRRLCRMLRDLADELSLPLRIWVPHVDCAGANIACVQKIAGHLGLHLTQSGVRWAACKGTADGQGTPIASVVAPKRPLSPRRPPKPADRTGSCRAAP